MVWGSSQQHKNDTYNLRLDRNWEMVRSTGQEYWEPSHTSWGWTEIGKWSGQLDRIIIGEPSHTSWGWTEIGKWSSQLDRIIENHHILAEDGQRLRNGQVNLTGSLRTITYLLRMDRDWEMVRPMTGSVRTITYKLRMDRDGEMVRSTWQDHWEASHTSWGWTEIGKWSGQHDRIIENYHIHQCGLDTTMCQVK